MDTGTHLVMGIALGGIASIDPVVQHSLIAEQTIMATTIIGSQIPDIDTLLKLKNNAVYIRNHRGLTHSLPFILIWPLLLTIVFSAFTHVPFLHIFMWALIAVSLHVFVDIFNAYGTQALRPISSKWIALGVINTFDTFIMIAHICGIALWLCGSNPFYTFSILYLVLFFYYVLRFYQKNKIQHKFKAIVPEATMIKISPTIRLMNWHIAAMSQDKMYVARYLNGELTILDTFERKAIPKSGIIQSAIKDKNISAFLSFSPIFRWEVHQYTDKIVVKFIDLRYWSKGHYPFVAIVELDNDLHILASYTGWVFNKDKLQKKLDISTR